MPTIICDCRLCKHQISTNLPRPSCDGLAEELLNALTKIEDLKVAARTSAFSFKGKNVDVSEIGKALHVETVLEGSVRKSGNRLRITVQLINVSDGYHLWSERYDREMKDIFDVQDEITLAVVEALKVKLLGEKKSAVLRRYTDNPEAMEWLERAVEERNAALIFLERELEAGSMAAKLGRSLKDTPIMGLLRREGLMS